MLFPTHQAVLISHHSHKSAAHTFFNPKMHQHFGKYSDLALTSNYKSTHCQERKNTNKVLCEGIGTWKEIIKMFHY